MAGRDSLWDARAQEAFDTLARLRGGLFTMSDQPLNLSLHVAQDRIWAADRDLRRALDGADRLIVEARASLADHPRHYGTSE